MSEKSVWRQRARRVITEVLLSISPGTPAEKIRAILRPHYPFGLREHHPYKCWLEEVKLAVDRWRGGPAKAKSGPPGVHFGFSLVRRLPWLEVYCDWCKGTRMASCLMCGQHRQQLQEIITQPLFLSLRRAMADGDSVAACALGDWLEERLQTRCGL